ncbi:hypothetical protein D7004_10810 [Pedobacter jejuensis]|uniref:Uncharacterized protein n=1 Tax=Pedobacter jejuensis TaxID=1268550 RepID=A0A3N0BUA8_9SPHI|nr:hypothetical protein D7004_10810 [Pedobacter jejuensis]
MTVPVSKALKFALLVSDQSGFPSAFVEFASFYIKQPFMKTKKLNAIKPYCFVKEVAQNHSIQNLLKNLICSPS